MIGFAPCKINLGLFITQKLANNYHTIESVFYPVALEDSIEIHWNEDKSSSLTILNNPQLSQENIENNLILKAFRLVQKDFPTLITKEINITLLKNIPIGAGLGGGSSDAVAAIRLLNTLAILQLTDLQIVAYAEQLGSDCAFFVHRTPCYVTGTGTSIQPISLSLKGYYLALCYPNVAISTKEAYSGVVPKPSTIDISKLDVKDIANWKHFLHNDFEDSLFPNYPILKNIKEELYTNGAVYASLSGSGSTVYGIFSQKPTTLDVSKYTVLVLD